MKRLLIYLSCAALLFSCRSKTPAFSGFDEFEVTIHDPLDTIPSTIKISSSDTFYLSRGGAIFQYQWSSGFTEAWTKDFQKSLVAKFNEIDFQQSDTAYYDSTKGGPPLHCTIFYKKVEFEQYIRISEGNKPLAKAAPENLTEFIYRLKIACDSKNRKQVNDRIDFKTREY